MNRLDEIERAIARASWATDDTIYFSTETRDDILALVAVARAAAEFEDALAAERRDPYNLELVHRTCIARNLVRMTLAPLLAEKEG